MQRLSKLSRQSFQKTSYQGPPRNQLLSYTKFLIFKSLVTKSKFISLNFFFWRGGASFYSIAISFKEHTFKIWSPNAYFKVDRACTPLNSSGKAREGFFSKYENFCQFTAYREIWKFKFLRQILENAPIPSLSIPLFFTKVLHNKIRDLSEMCIWYLLHLHYL